MKTTDTKLVLEGVQPLSSDFLVWFGQNPDCEKIEVTKHCSTGRICNNKGSNCDKATYKLIIPEIKTTQYPIGGFAPGYYSCKCVTCKKEFQGDKRAVQCESCAIEMVNTKTIINDNGGIEIDHLEEAAEKYADKQSSKSMRSSSLEFSKSGEELWLESKTDFIEGAKWQAEQLPESENKYTKEVVVTICQAVVYKCLEDSVSEIKEIDKVINLVLKNLNYGNERILNNK